MSLFAPPAIYLVAALICCFLPRRGRAVLLLAVPVAGLVSIFSYAPGVHEVVQVLGFELSFVRMDGMARTFAVIFSIAAALAALYAFHVHDRLEQIGTLVYAGSAIGAVLAGDLITLFLWWEATALASVFLMWARRTTGAMATGMRYLIIQVLSGVLLLTGLLLHYYDTGSIAFDQLGVVSPGTAFIFVAFGIKCAFPLLHNWLADAYPAGTITGTVVLSIFTTKMAVYALARGYAGTEMLIWIGSVMALSATFLAVIQNDLRRTLSYSLIGQLGFMVVGVGIGSELALNGAMAHAFCSVLYQGLLFMCMGTVLYRTGTSKASELGGLARTMPITAACCLVGAASISAVPLFSGFVSKSLTLSAAAYDGHYFAWYALLIASIGVLCHTAIRIPYTVFFGEDSGKRPAEAPVHMRAAMIVTAALCVVIGVYPAPLYALLPFEVDYSSYTVAHLLTQLQMLAFAGLSYIWLMRRGLLTADKDVMFLDTDIVYRRWLPAALPAVSSSITAVWHAFQNLCLGALSFAYQRVEKVAAPGAILAQGWSVGTMMFVVIVVMAVLLFANLL